MKFGTQNIVEQTICPVGDHRCCWLVERTIHTMKPRLGVLLPEEDKRSIKLCLRTIVHNLPAKWENLADQILREESKIGEQNPRKKSTRWRDG